MESSKTPQEWNDNCRKVKAAFDKRYPPFWYEAIIASGLADRVIKAAGDPHGASIRVVAP
jgi:hypothetical protein